jgi:hypothetical protein
MQLMPDQFSDYLLHEVGFTTSHTVAVPRHASKGFQRPIQVSIGSWDQSMIFKNIFAKKSAKKWRFFLLKSKLKMQNFDHSTNFSPKVSEIAENYDNIN